MREITAKVIGSTSVLIKTEKDGHTLNDELIAVNWFDTKTEWLYHLYNTLASKSVKKIGGIPLFKAKVLEDISDDRYRREILLLVKYPNGNAFKQLMQSNYFKVVSLLRMQAVKRFTFGFTKAIVQPQFRKTYQHYAIHNYTSSSDKDVVMENMEEIQQGNISVLYKGYTFASLSKVSNGEPEKIESIVDNIIIYGAEDKQQLSDFLNSDSYSSHFGTQQNEYKGFIKRIF